jgi:hypothetical protein
LVHFSSVEGITQESPAFRYGEWSNVDGKEVLREARFVHVELLKEKVEKIYFLTEQV